MTRTIRLGISTCPNDTFAFHALLNGLVDARGLEFDVRLLDIQQLNNALYQDEFDVGKASFNAALHLSDRMWVLPCGSALGFGVGPLLLAAQEGTQPEDPAQLTLCPGRDTTAHLLYQLFYPRRTQVEQVIFSEIMPRLQAGTADFGVCIHEGRFTWQDQGLACVEDLGTRWETETGTPLPLGGLLASRELDRKTLSAVTQVIRDSLEYALADMQAPLPTMRHYAQEFDDQVLMKHVELYVNEWTRDLGPVGSQALQTLEQRSRVLLPGLHHGQLEIFQPGIQLH